MTGPAPVVRVSDPAEATALAALTAGQRHAEFAGRPSRLTAVVASDARDASC